MFKYLISFFIAFFFISCSSKKVVQTTYPKKPVVTVTKNLPKKVEVVVPIVVKTPQIEIQTEVLQATSNVKVTTAMVLAYIEKYKPIAKSNMQQFGVPASIILAQALLESGSGTGGLCQMANNHFGIKCKEDWKGPSVRYDDDAPQECFRKYAEPCESFKDHSTFLKNRPWYAKLFKLNVKDYKAWAFGLKKAGYATDPKYPQKLIGLIEKYKLYEIDDEVFPDVIEEKKVNPLNDNDVIPETIEIENNYTVLSKDTFYSISKKFNITIDHLKKINNLTENTLTVGQILKIK
jgi:flagellum-specific peptidoglycan hydrolase FlgJ